MVLSVSEELHLFSQELQRFLSPTVLKEITKQVALYNDLVSIKQTDSLPFAYGLVSVFDLIKTSLYPPLQIMKLLINSTKYTFLFISNLTKMIKETNLPFLLHRSSFVGPHTFRHAFAIISHLSKVDVYQNMRSTGHEKIGTTMIYLEKTFEKERHAIQAWKPDVFG